MTKKITQKEMYTALVKFVVGEDTDVSTDEMIEFLNGRIDALDKKTANRKPTKVQKENVALKEIIMSVLTNEGATVSEIQTRDERISPASEISNQKVTSLLTQLIKEDKVVKTIEGKKSLYRLA